MDDDARRSASRLTLQVEMGRRVAVLANLLLAPKATPATTWASTSLARALDDWDGPGTVVVAGNLFDLHLDAAVSVDEQVEGALAAHDRLGQALARFTACDGRRVVFLPGRSDGAVGTDRAARRRLQDLGVALAGSVELVLATAAGIRMVEVTPATPPLSHTSGPALLTSPAAMGQAPAGAVAADPAPAGGDTVAPVQAVAAPAGGDTVAPWAGLLCPDPDSPWQDGLDRLADPAAARRFLTSRLLYRRFARFSWWLLIPYAVVLLLRDPSVSSFFLHVDHGRGVSARALQRARSAGWGTRLAVATGVAIVGLLVLAGVLALLSRKAWTALGGGLLPAPWRRGTEAADVVNDTARDAARSLVQAGRAGLVTGATPRPELTHLGAGFFACSGASGQLVEEHPGRLGLPPVFVTKRQLAWVELETGAQLHARLLLAQDDEPGASVLERLCARPTPGGDTQPTVVASFPQGASWPPAPDLQAVRRRSRRVRRWGAALLALSGAVDLLSAVTPPLRGRLHVVLHLLPLGVSQAAGALVALAGVSLLALARGVRRGQRRAWLVSAVVLGVTVVLHAIHGGDLVALLIAAASLTVLLVHQAEFRAASDRPSLRSAVVAVVAGAVLTTVAATTAIELKGRVDADGSRPMPLWRAVRAVAGRLVGVRTIPLPGRLEGFLGPGLLTIGVLLVVAAVLLATRPVVDRASSGGWAAELRARDVVRRHGQGTLDYFALRRDKQWFFHRDSLVAYGLYSGICLVSPDPIGPPSERAQVWGAFRRFADSKGWAVTVMGAAEHWLPLYRSTGMRDIYIGDEAVVDVQRFSLGGGHMKGLRQAYNRVSRYGYTARFLDPARVPTEEAQRLVELLDQSRRGERERGFSMMLGRLFDRRDDGLLMCVVDGPDGQPVAMCQFVPAPGIGGFSVDLMRRSKGEHPNGLIDFALIATIEHLREQQLRGLSLNFAAMRSILDGERGDGIPVRVERWALERMSSFLQIETLWRFNAKYQPRWLPRYVAYDAAEHLVPSILAIVRAESLWEVPVLGRLIAAAERRGRAAQDTSAPGAPEITELPEAPAVAPPTSEHAVAELPEAPAVAGRTGVPAAAGRVGAPLRDAAAGWRAGRTT